MTGSATQSEFYIKCLSTSTSVLGISYPVAPIKSSELYTQRKGDLPEHIFIPECSVKTSKLSKLHPPQIILTFWSLNTLLDDLLDLQDKKDN